MTKFIEERFPILELSSVGRKEKSSRFNNISGIHVWWARRPTSICRALILSSLIDYPRDAEEKKAINKLIIEVCSDYKKIPEQLIIKDQIKALIRKAYSENIPLLLDPFCGGGAIPLEGARIGIENFGFDLNPISVLISKLTCEYFEKFGINLLKEGEKWWNELKKKLIKKIGSFYENPNNSNKILAFLWVRQIICTNPDCNAKVPLLSSLKLVEGKGFKIALKPIIKRREDGNEIHFDIKYNKEIDFEYEKVNYFSDGKVTCPACEMTLTNKETMDRVKEKSLNDKLLVVVEESEKNKQKVYRLANEQDLKKIQEANIKLKELSALIPKERLPEKVRRWQVQNYGILKWQDLFNERQLLFPIVYSLALSELFNQINKEYEDKEFIKALMVLLSFILSRIVNHNSKFGHFNNSTQSVAQTWSRIGLFMKGFYPEINPFVDYSGTPKRYLNFLKKLVINNLNFQKTAIINQGNAMNLICPNNSIDIIITDPPYYDAMLYADPSDFFYIWLKKYLAEVFPELFLFALTPKDEEIIQSRFRHGGDKLKAREFYETSLSRVLIEFERVLKPEGIGVIMYTHKSVVAWEVLIKALIKSNLSICAAWPIGTETIGGLRALNKVSLSSSIAIVFKKKKKVKSIFFETQFKEILEKELKLKLRELLFELHIYGADFFIASIGYSLKIYTQYEEIKSTKTGKNIEISEYLDLVRKIVNEFLLSTVIEPDVAKSIDIYTNLYIIWCWFFRNTAIELDDALKLAQSFGLGELDDLIKKKIITKEKSKYKLLLGSDLEREKYLLKNQNSLTTLIEVLHFLSISWKENNKNLNELVKKYDSEYGQNLWKVAQALAEFFPSKSRERNYLQGLLAKFSKTIKSTSLNEFL